MTGKNTPNRIEYPRPWDYKIIGLTEDAVRIAIVAVVAGRDYKLAFSKFSKKGKYLSFDLEMEVRDQADRDRIFNLLKQRPEIRMVI